MNLKRFLRGWIKANKNFLKAQYEQRKINVLQKIDYRDLYQRVHRESEPCFVLSTGRCGTELLNKLFKQHSQLKTYHKPMPELIYYSRFAYENYRTQSDKLKSIVDSSRYEYIRDCYLINKKFIETNNRITFFAYQLAELFPKATFIHLVRNPINFIKSGLARNWYTGYNLHDEGRIIMYNDQEKWDRLNQAEKIAWLWNETNQFVEEFKKSCDSSRMLTVTAEKFFSSPETGKRIFEFFDIKSLGLGTISTVIKKPINVSDKKKLQAADFRINDTLVRLIPLATYYKYEI